MEKILKVPNDALTREIKMTQELLEMFIKYQIPSDLLSFGGHDNEAVDVKVEHVRHNLKQMQEMIADIKNKEVSESVEKMVYEQPLLVASSVKDYAAEPTYIQPASTTIPARSPRRGFLSKVKDMFVKKDKADESGSGVRETLSILRPTGWKIIIFFS